MGLLDAYATTAESDFSSPCIIGFGSSPSRCGPPGQDRHRRSNWRSPGSRARSVHACQGLRPRRVALALAMARQCVLPSVNRTTSAPGSKFLRGSMAGLHVPLSTLRGVPRGTPRMTRGQHGSLRLYCEGLAPFAPCRSPGAPDAKLTRVFHLPCCFFKHGGTGVITMDMIGPHRPSSGAATLPSDTQAAPGSVQPNRLRLTQSEPRKIPGMPRHPHTSAANTASAAGGQNGETWVNSAAGNLPSRA